MAPIQAHLLFLQPVLKRANGGNALSDWAGIRGARVVYSVRMIFIVLFGILAMMTISPSVIAQGIIAMPGFLWGQARTPSSRQAEERDNEIVEGAIHQGIDWLQIAKGIRANSFVQFDFTRDTKRFDYNNKLKYSIGSQLKFSISDWANIGIGGKYEWDRRYVSNRTPKGALGFLNWSAARSWVPKSHAGLLGWLPLGYSLSTWGQFSYPSSQEIEERGNAIVEGSIESAADLWKQGDVLVFSTFLSMAYKADTEEFDFNNEIEPSIGARLRLLVIEKGFIEFGAKFVNEYRFITRRSEPGSILFLNWAASW